MSRITVTIYKHGLALEADLSRLTRTFQREKKMGYKQACIEAEKELDPIAFTQVLHSESEELAKYSELQLLGEHIAHGSPFDIVRE